MSHLLDPNLAKAYEKDREWLAQAAVPIVTVSGTFREEVKRLHHLPNTEARITVDSLTDVVLSRAHFSMALGIAVEAWQGHVNHQRAWMVDPTNFVSPERWKSIQFTEAVGKTLARHAILKQFKDLLDTFGRNKLPILESITPPLLHLTENIDRPILSFHIAAGNILSEHGKQVVQVVTDPQVRYDYLTQAHRPNISFCVFDERTQLEFLEQAAIQKISIDPQRIIVTGPPVDPRVVAARAKKTAWRNGPLHLCITTGGLGTNKKEIQQALESLLPLIHKQPSPLALVVYAGTQRDIFEMVKEMARAHRIAIGENHDRDAKFRLLYHPHIFDANELLIHYGFPWAHGFLTKPSGDMAYDAVASGAFLLTFQEWGIWEERIREIFEQKDIARKVDVTHLAEQLLFLMQPRGGQSWVEHAMNRAFGIEKLFLLGSKKILETVEKQR